MEANNDAPPPIDIEINDQDSQKTSNKKWYFLGAGLAVVLIAGLVAYALNRPSATEGATPGTTAEQTSADTTQYVPAQFFSVGSDVYAHTADEDRPILITELAVGDYPLRTIVNTDGSTDLLVLSNQHGEFFNTYKTLLRVSADSQRTTVYEAEDESSIGGNYVAYDPSSGDLFVEEFYPTTGTLPYNTRIARINAESGDRNVLLDRAAFPASEDRGPIFPLTVLSGELILGQTSCYECDGPGYARAYSIESGELELIAQATLEDGSNHGHALFHPDADYMYLVAAQYLTQLSMPTPEAIAQQNLDVVKIASDLSVTNESYESLQVADDVIDIKGLDLRSNSLFGVINEVVNDDNDTLTGEYAYRTFAGLDQNGNLSPFKVISQRLNSHNVDVAYRSDSGLFFVISDFDGADGAETGAFFLSTAVDDGSGLIPLEINENNSEHPARDLGLGTIIQQ